MKKIVLLFCTVLCLGVSIQAQDITVSGNCINGSLSQIGDDGGSPKRNIYDWYDSSSFYGLYYRVEWNDVSKVWRISQNGITLYENNFDSSPNPPALGTGTWVDVAGCASLSQFEGTGTQTSLTLLPVKLLSFTGLLENDEVTLNWTTLSEQNNSHFDIERSVNGIDFEVIAAVQGNGTTTTQHDYTFTDSSLVNGEIQYRLRQVDFDGNFEYSKIVSIFVNSITNVEIYPNPAYDVLNVKHIGDVKVFIYDVTGRLVVETNTKTINVSQLSSGTYFVKVIKKDKLLAKETIIIK